MGVMKLQESLIPHDRVKIRLNHLQPTQRITMKAIVNLEQFRQLKIKPRLLLSSIIILPLNPTLIIVITQLILTQHMVTIMDIHIGIINKKSIFASLDENAFLLFILSFINRMFNSINIKEVLTNSLDNSIEWDT